jgi:hypothetical protein
MAKINNQRNLKCRNEISKINRKSIIYEKKKVWRHQSSNNENNGVAIIYRSMAAWRKRGSGSVKIAMACENQASAMAKNNNGEK